MASDHLLRSTYEERIPSTDLSRDFMELVVAGSFGGSWRMTGKSLGSRLAWACHALGFCVALQSFVLCTGGKRGISKFSPFLSI